MTEQELIRSIREEYSGLRDKPRESLASSVKTLADDLYAKDTHFIFELIQNAEDNDYAPGVTPSLRFEVCELEIEGVSGPALIVHNNETGFRQENVEALCQVGQSTKKKAQGYIGEKGIGFKSVFRITHCPYIFSNRFQFCIPDKDPETGLGYIVPRWVATVPPSIAANETSIVLPLDKDAADVESISRSLRDIAPETLIFLQKLESIEVAIRLPGETYEVVIEKRIQPIEAGSSRVELTHLLRNEAGEEIASSAYWLTSIDYRRPDTVTHEKRQGIDTRTVSVALPLDGDADGDRLFAYLPVWDETGLPFLINADFLLVSSREGVKEDEPWNVWLRDCVANAYTESFMALLECQLLPTSEKYLAYGSVPQRSNNGFLKPIIENVRALLRQESCVAVLPDGSLIEPAQARLCSEEFRSILGSPEALPNALNGGTRLVVPEIERYLGPLKSIGVRSLSADEQLACLKDHDWVYAHPSAWFIDLFRYLSGESFDTDALAAIPIIPVSGDSRENTYRLSCDAEQPIYLRSEGEDRADLLDIPNWLLDLAPIAFIAPDLMTLIERESDQEELETWLARSLNVFEFSINNYCIDIAIKLEAEHAQVHDVHLIDATKFLAMHARAGFDWSDIPMILSSGRRLSLKEAKQIRKDIVVPADLDPDSGWVNIWSESKDRTHFVALASGYASMPREWFELVNVKQYPGFQLIEYGFWPRQRPQASPELDLFEKCLQLAATSRYGETMVISYAVPTSLVVGEPNSATEQVSRSVLHLMQTSDVSNALISRGIYQNYGPKSETCVSSLGRRLQLTAWLPTTKGLVSPSRAFLPTPGIKEVFGDSVPYFEGDLPDKVIRLLGIRSDITIPELLGLLREHSGGSAATPEFVERVYAQLHARSHVAPQEIRDRFANEPFILIIAPDGSSKWYKSGECVWDDASDVLGDSFVYLAAQYPKLQQFFVERLGVKRRVDTESFATRWLALQDEPIRNPEKQEALVERLYREIRPVALAEPGKRHPWWERFAKNVKVFTQQGTFVKPEAAVLPDDGELREIFQGGGDVVLTWRPEKDSFNEWLPFYTALGTPILSEAVSEYLVGRPPNATQNGKRSHLTDDAVKMIAAWLREKRREDYDRLLESGAFAKLISLRETHVAGEIEIAFTLSLGRQNHHRKATYAAFWSRDENLLLYCSDAKPNQIAKVLAKGLITNQAYKDLAHWIELVLGATDTERLKDENWAVPQAVLDLFPKSTPVRPPKPTATAAPDAKQTTNGATPSSPAQSVSLHASTPAEPTKQGGNGAAERVPDGTSKTPAIQNHSETSGRRTTESYQNSEPKGGADAKSERSAEARSDSESSETVDFDYAAELVNAFQRKGMTMLADDDDDLSDNDGAGTVKNPQRRRERLAERHREAIRKEPALEERRRMTERSLLEGPNEAVRTSLHEWYDGRCQICDETWPKLDGEPYFTAAYLVERRHARWIDDPGNALCLCADHFAQWRLAAKEMPLDVIEQVRSLRLRSEDGDGDLSLWFTLMGEDCAIKYDERHFLALRTLLDVAEEFNSQPSQ